MNRSLPLPMTLILMSKYRSIENGIKNNQFSRTVNYKDNFNFELAKSFTISTFVMTLASQIHSRYASDSRTTLGLKWTLMRRQKIEKQRCSDVFLTSPTYSHAPLLLLRQLLLFPSLLLPRGLSDPSNVCAHLTGNPEGC